jgi:hypothetical protein
MSLGAGLETDAGVVALDQTRQLRVLFPVDGTPSDDLAKILQAAVSDANADSVLSLILGRNPCKELYRTVPLSVGVKFVQQLGKLYQKRNV